jgi:two-component system sensor histidine kinase BarA
MTREKSSLLPKQPRSVTNPVSEKENLSSLRALVADDSEASRSVLGAQLASIGITCITFADDGLHAIALCEDQQFDVILMDLRMPRVDGFIATEKIRSLGERTTKPFIVGVSAQSNTRSNLDAQLAGMDRFIVKPINQELLRSFICDHFSCS